jgi:hypothetical protein
MKHYKTPTITITKKEVGELLKQENLLPFNRKIKESHANGIRDSLLTYGLIKPPVLVVLKYDNDKKAIGDGQHTLTALYSLMKSNDLVEVSVIKCNTKRDVIDLIAKLNTTGKGWVLDDFLHSWINFGYDNEQYPNYEFIQNRMEQSGLTLDKILSIFVKNKPKFKKGTVIFNEMIFAQTTYLLTKHFRLKYNFPSHTLSGVVSFGKSVKFQSPDNVKDFVSRVDAYISYLKSKRQMITQHRENIKNKLHELYDMNDFEFAKLISND